MTRRPKRGTVIARAAQSLRAAATLAEKAVASLDSVLTDEERRDLRYPREYASHAPTDLRNLASIASDRLWGREPC